MNSRCEPWRVARGMLTQLRPLLAPWRCKRLGWFVAALLQLVLPPFAAAADAGVERESQSVHAHVESHGTRGCPRVHPAHCIVCRGLDGGAGPSGGVVLPIAIARVIAAEPERAMLTRIVARLAGDPPQRAPPA